MNPRDRYMRRVRIALRDYGRRVRQQQPHSQRGPGETRCFLCGVVEVPAGTIGRYPLCDSCAVTLDALRSPTGPIRLGDQP